MKISPYILLSLASFFWSLNFIIGKLVVDVFPPITLSFFRWGFPAIFYLFYSWKDIKANQQVYKEHWLLILSLGATGYCFNSIAVYEAVLYTSTINTSFINSFNPVLIALTGFVCYRYLVSPIQAMGFIVSLIGLIWIIFKGNPVSLLNLSINIGDFMMLGSIVFWAIYTIIYKKHANVLPVKSRFTMMILGGIIITLPMMLVENIFFGMDWMQQIRYQHIIGIICLSIFPSVLAYRFWNEALDKVAANKVAIFQYLIPIYTVIISLLFLDEKLQIFQIVGGILIFIGVFLVVGKST